MEDQIVYDDVVRRVLIIMKDTFGDTFTSYYDDDPIQIPKDSLPAIIVDEPVMQVRQDATGTDRLTTGVRVKLVLDKMDDLGASDDFNMTGRKLRRLVEARDSQTGAYNTGTVLWALRQHITMGDAVLDQQVDVKYDILPRPNQMVTSEATITLTTTQRVIRSSQVPMPNPGT